MCYTNFFIRNSFYFCNIVNFNLRLILTITFTGNCLEVSSKGIIPQSCSTFANGCPDGPFHLSDVHRCKKPLFSCSCMHSFQRKWHGVLHLYCLFIFWQHIWLVLG